MLRLLPNKTEIEGLLVDISQAGLASGLEFQLFKPSAEVKEDFIATLPISIEVTGTFHEFGEFISSVAALPRIVTQHDLRMSPNKDAKKKQKEQERNPQSDLGSIPLTMKMVAKTYRYLEEDEVQKVEKDGKGKKGKRNRKSRRKK